jgi:UDP-N-acetylmuramate: L-alanyl-gamma-D-glutamyl-meso-diaminopimelate ligase
VARKDIILVPYGNLTYRIHNKKFYIVHDEQETPLMVFGKHNLQNIQGAWKICLQLGIDDRTFFKAISSFSGASRRLQLLKKNKDSSVYKDFAHSPSKLKATVEALKELYPERELIACLELHTFSSLNKAFLPQYQGCMEKADRPIVYFSHHALALKRLPELTAEEVRTAFKDDRLSIYNDSAKMQEDLLTTDYHNKNLLLMSSGNFDGLDMEELARKVLSSCSSK